MPSSYKDISLYRESMKEIKQLHLFPKYVDLKENDLQTLVTDLSDVTQATVPSRTVLVADCQEMQSVDSYI